MEPGTWNLTLMWIERSLLTAGVVLGLWCAVTMLEARFVKSLPVPHQYVEVGKALPGDSGSETPAPAAGTWLARMEMPSLKLTATVLEGSDDGTLSRGAGHIEDTPLPGDVSAGSNIGIAGHRDTIFRPLRNVHEGDLLTITTSNGTYTYRVVKTTIVGPDDVYVLDPTQTPTVTLVTCFPFEFIGHAPKRFVVRAELADQAPSGESGGSGK